MCYTEKNAKGEIEMKRVLAGLLAGFLVLSLAACRAREASQTEQIAKPAQEEISAPEVEPEKANTSEAELKTEPEESSQTAPETEPEQEAAIGLSEIFSTDAGEAAAAELDSDARAYFFDFAAQWRLDLMPVPANGVWPKETIAYLEWLEVTTPWEERTGRLEISEVKERIQAEFYGVAALSDDGAWEIEDGAYVSPYMDEIEYRGMLPERISWQTDALGTNYTLTLLAPGDWDGLYRELREKYVQEAGIPEESAGRVYVSFLLGEVGAPVFTNKARAEETESLSLLAP